MKCKNINHFLFFVLLLILIFLPIFEAKGEESPAQERVLLEQRVKELLKTDNVTIRRGVDDVFLLADLYAADGDDADAISLYEIALRVDSGRLEYQLKLAQLLYLHDSKDQSVAIEKAKMVFTYAEDEELIRKAEKFLTDLQIDVSEDMPASGADALSHVEIVLVPIGDVNKKLLSEIKVELQRKMGITYSIADEGMDIGKIDRTYYDRYIQLSKKESWISRIIAGTMYIFNAEYKTYIDGLKITGQYDAARFKTELAGRFTIKNGSNIIGYLGITGHDIFANDSNFLFGWASKGNGVMSYHRFTAAFNNVAPHRPRLRKRTEKQVISSSFFILGIQRCTTPYCSRAYPHSLDEHDQKGNELCSWCKEQLSKYIINSSK